MVIGFEKEIKIHRILLYCAGKAKKRQTFCAVFGRVRQIKTIMYHFCVNLLDFSLLYFVVCVFESGLNSGRGDLRRITKDS